MPDWISHIFIGLTICELFNVKKKSLVLIGTLLPDLLIKMHLLELIIPVKGNKIYWAMLPYHSPAGAVLITLLIVQLFKFNRLKAFLLVTVGWVSHLVADLTNKHMLEGGMRLFLPLSWKYMEFGITWAEQYYINMGVTALIYLIVVIIKNVLIAKSEHHQ